VTHIHRIGRAQVALVAALTLLSGCGVNPVTGKKELQLVSAEQEISIGAQQYAPMRQAEGGDYILDAELTRYVASVGAKLAAVADRQLPYEFTVINNSVPNAWALPGGKIAVNRGLLLALESEAELAAVLSHEIVHAAARHGAKAQERSIFVQGGAVVAGTLGSAVLGDLAAQGAILGAELVTMKYGRDAESEADLYGMTYMKRAGYDPAAAVKLQETFVRLFDGKKPDWLSGMFASHPPSIERVEANRRTLATVGAGGEWGREVYAQHLAPLRKAAPAYAKYDEAREALAKQDAARAQALASESARLVPREARFQELLGDVAMSRKSYAAAATQYDKAIQLDPGYFKPYVTGGIARYQAGEKAAARSLFDRSWKILPTAPAAYYLGRYAEEAGDVDGALKYYQAAASSQSAYGKEAAVAAARLGISRNPGQYLAFRPQLGNDGQVYVALQNRAPLAVTGVRLTVALVDGSGQAIQGPRSVTLGDRVLGPGEVVTTGTGLGALADGSTLDAFRVRVDALRPVEP
jgi:predicted Zn-dependent protease